MGRLHRDRDGIGLAVVIAAAAALVGSCSTTTAPATSVEDAGGTAADSYDVLPAGDGPAVRGESSSQTDAHPDLAVDQHPGTHPADGGIGGCAVACGGSTPLCAPTSDGSGFNCVATCPAEADTMCGGSCVDVASHPAHCGGCDRLCTTRVPNARPTCIGNACTFQCNPAYHACGRGCVDFNSDARNCGGCGPTHACGANEVCRDGGCVCPSPCDGACVNLETDGNNCGVCGHGCQGGACIGGSCQPVMLASGQQLPWRMAIDAANVYWTDTRAGTLMKVPKVGGPAVTLAVGQASASGVALDASSVYWTRSGSGGGVMKLPLTGGTPVTLATGGRNFQGIAVDASYVYFTDDTAPRFGGAVMKVPIGGGSTLPVATPEQFPFALALTARDIYWTSYPGQNVIRRAPIAGGTPVNLVAMPSPTGNLQALAVDDTHLYWCETVPGRILKVPLEGGAAVLLGSTNSARGMAVDGTDVYWADQGAHAIMSVPKAGGTPVIVASDQAEPYDVAVDATTVFWINGAGGTVMKQAK